MATNKDANSKSSTRFNVQSDKLTNTKSFTSKTSGVAAVSKPGSTNKDGAVFLAKSSEITRSLTKSPLPTATQKTDPVRFRRAGQTTFTQTPTTEGRLRPPSVLSKDNSTLFSSNGSCVDKSCSTSSTKISPQPSASHNEGKTRRDSSLVRQLVSKINRSQTKLTSTSSSSRQDKQRSDTVSSRVVSGPNSRMNQIAKPSSLPFQNQTKTKVINTHFHTHRQGVEPKINTNHNRCNPASSSKETGSPLYSRQRQPLFARNTTADKNIQSGPMVEENTTDIHSIRFHNRHSRSQTESPPVHRRLDRSLKLPPKDRSPDLRYKEQTPELVDTQPQRPGPLKRTNSCKPDIMRRYNSLRKSNNVKPENVQPISNYQATVDIEKTDTAEQFDDRYEPLLKPSEQKRRGENTGNISPDPFTRCNNPLRNTLPNLRSSRVKQRQGRVIQTSRVSTSSVHNAGPGEHTVTPQIDNNDCDNKEQSLDFTVWGGRDEGIGNFERGEIHRVSDLIQRFDRRKTQTVVSNTTQDANKEYEEKGSDNGHKTSAGDETNVYISSNRDKLPENEINDNNNNTNDNSIYRVYDANTNKTPEIACNNISSEKITANDSNNNDRCTLKALNRDNQNERSSEESISQCNKDTTIASVQNRRKVFEKDIPGNVREAPPFSDQALHHEPSPGISKTIQVYEQSKSTEGETTIMFDGEITPDQQIVKTLLGNFQNRYRNKNITNKGLGGQNMDDSEPLSKFRDDSQRDHGNKLACSSSTSSNISREIKRKSGPETAVLFKFKINGDTTGQPTLEAVGGISQVNDNEYDHSWDNSSKCQKLIGVENKEVTENLTAIKLEKRTDNSNTDNGSDVPRTPLVSTIATGEELSHTEPGTIILSTCKTGPTHCQQDKTEVNDIKVYHRRDNAIKNNLLCQGDIASISQTKNQVWSHGGSDETLCQIETRHHQPENSLSSSTSSTVDAGSGGENMFSSSTCSDKTEQNSNNFSNMSQHQDSSKVSPQALGLRAIIDTHKTEPTKACIGRDAEMNRNSPLNPNNSSTFDKHSEDDIKATNEETNNSDAPDKDNKKTNNNHDEFSQESDTKSTGQNNDDSSLHPDYLITKETTKITQPSIQLSRFKSYNEIHKQDSPLSGLNSVFTETTFDKSLSLEDILLSLHRSKLAKDFATYKNVDNFWKRASVATVGQPAATSTTETGWDSGASKTSLDTSSSSQTSEARSRDDVSPGERITNALQLLKTELKALRDQDLSLLKQLIAISEAIQRVQRVRTLRVSKSLSFSSSGLHPLPTSTTLALPHLHNRFYSYENYSTLSNGNLENQAHPHQLPSQQHPGLQHTHQYLNHSLQLVEERGVGSQRRHFSHSASTTVSPPADDTHTMNTEIRTRGLHLSMGNLTTLHRQQSLPPTADSRRQNWRVGGGLRSSTETCSSLSSFDFTSELSSPNELEESCSSLYSLFASTPAINQPMARPSSTSSAMAGSLHSLRMPDLTLDPKMEAESTEKDSQSYEEILWRNVKLWKMNGRHNSRLLQQVTCLH